MSTQDPLAFLSRGGEMGKLTRTFDWSKTTLGAAERWPQSLRTVIRIMLDSRYAMWLGWGSELTFFYNDAYAAMTLGPKHPWALGRPTREVWPEIWGDIGPRAEQVLQAGEATWDEGLLLFLERRGFREETYHTFSYSPVPADDGTIGGLLCVVTEDTERRIGERRLKTLRELGARTIAEAASSNEVCSAAVSILGGNQQDIPFALVYLLHPDGRTATLAATSGVEPESRIAPQTISLDGENSNEPWPLAAVAKSGKFEQVGPPNESFGVLPGGAWGEPPKVILVLPMMTAGQTQLAGFVVCGVSARLPFDDGYRGFLELLTGQIAAAVAKSRAIEEERQRSQALAELDRAKTTFFSNISHEFRTPLTLMLGPVDDLLGASDALPGESRQQLEMVNRNGLRLLRLVNTLLDFSRIEAGRVRAVFQPTDLGSYTGDLASNFRSACERAGLRLETDCAAIDEPVYVDRGMWEKIVLNLLSNAFKFTLEGAITVSLRRTGDFVELAVRDTGTGIPAAELPRLFERFHRIENSRGRTHEGSGIGLALVQELIKLHGGTISAESSLGAGTTFIVRLPMGRGHLPADQVSSAADRASSSPAVSPFVEEALRWLPESDTESAEAPFESLAMGDEAAEEPRNDRAPNPRRVEKPRILVADDNADMRRYIIRLLERRYSVRAVSDGEEAVSAAKEHRPDLVLSDVMMPRLDGFGLIRKLRSDPQTREIPVILLSARAGEESRIEGVEAGADDYIVKPFSARELLARVSGLLLLSKLRRDTQQQLRESELKYRTLFETMSEGFAIDELLYDDEGRVCDLRYLELNPAFERHTGLKREDVLGRTTTELFPNAEYSWFEKYRTVVETGIPAHFRSRFGPLGRWFEVRSYRAGENKIATVFSDITDQQRAEHERQMFVSLAQNSHEFVGICDLSYRPIFVNEAGRRLVGLDHENGLDKKSIFDFFFPEDLPFLENEFVPKVLREGHGETEIRFRHFQTGEPIWMVYNILVLNDEEGKPAAIGTVSLNISDHKRAEIALREADQRKDEFLATLAHELRNPLAPLVSTLKLIKISGGDGQTIGHARELMERQVAQMVRLVDDLLDMSRIGRGLIELQRSRENLESILRLAIETSRPLLTKGGTSSH